MIERIEDLPDRLRRKVSENPSTGCWEWTGYTPPSGYASSSFNYKKMYIHRVVLELSGVEIPDGMQVDHVCRNRKCCRPNHLDVVTGAENLRRGNGASAVNFRKTTCKHGHPLFGDNVRIRKSGKRQCMECQRQHDSVERARNVEKHRAWDRARYLRNKAKRTNPNPA